MKSLDFEKMIKDGEGSGTGGFRAQTVNGTARWSGTGWNRRESYEMPEVTPDRTRPAGRSNRTGE